MRQLKALGFLFILALLAAPLAAEAQQAGKVYRIGMLLHVNDPSDPARIAFREGLRALGWVEGQNVLLEYRYAEGHYERFDPFIAEFLRMKVDVIVASINPAIVAAKRATTTIPIVTVFAMEPVQMGYAASLARPGGNVTGITLVVGDELFGKQLELLREGTVRGSFLASV